MLSASLAVGAWFLKSSGVEAGVKDASRAAAATVKKHLAPALTATEVRAPMSEEEASGLQRIVGSRILDQDTTTVRIWTASGTLVYSSTGEPTGTRGGDDRGIRLATSGEGKTTSIVPASQLGVLDIYTPLRVGAGRDSEAAVEVVEEYAPIFEAAGQPWNLVQSIAGGLAAIALLLVIVSFALQRAAAGRETRRRVHSFRRVRRRDEKLQRTIVARDEQLTQLRAQLKEQESETVERIRELEIQVRDAAARVVEAEARSGDTAGLAEAAQEANRRAQEQLDRAVRAEGELSALREHLKEAPAADSKEAEHRIQVLEEQLRTVSEERDRAAADLKTLETTALDTEARAEELAQRAEELKNTLATQGQGDDPAADELRTNGRRDEDRARRVGARTSRGGIRRDGGIHRPRIGRRLDRGVAGRARTPLGRRGDRQGRSRRPARPGRGPGHGAGAIARRSARPDESSSFGSGTKRWLCPPGWRLASRRPPPRRRKRMRGRKHSRAGIQEMAKNAGNATEGLKSRLGELEVKAADAESQQKVLVERAAEAEGSVAELKALISAAKAREAELVERIEAADVEKSRTTAGLDDARRELEETRDALETAKREASQAATEIEVREAAIRADADARAEARAKEREGAHQGRGRGARRRGARRGGDP